MASYYKQYIARLDGMLHTSILSSYFPVANIVIPRTYTGVHTAFTSDTSAAENKNMALKGAAA